jgi:hypothetical protein
VARTRTTKKLAQRIDLNYFKRPTPLKRAKFWLSLLLPLLALLWITERTIFKDSRVYSSGRLSEPHAILEKQCDLCHSRIPGEFSAKANIFGCLNCHDGPRHHSTDLAQNDCISCHLEHRGRISISAPSNQACARCHSDLRAHRGRSSYANQIRSFEDDHPEFAVLRSVESVAAKDPGTIKLNHAIHMKPIRTGSSGSTVQLSCGNCHAPSAVPQPITYSDSDYIGAKVSYGEGKTPGPGVVNSSAPRHPDSGWELMAPVKFANACAGCHVLTFDKRFNEGAPHDKPAVVRAFVVKRFAEYIAMHAGELRETQDPERQLTGKPLPPRTRALTASQWVGEKTAVAEELLWHKTCAQCHQMSVAPLQDTRIARWSPANANSAGRIPSTSQAESLADQQEHLATRELSLPTVASANTTLRWMPHAKFDHGAHEGFTCVSCHAKALTSTESSDVLLPGIETCKKCHAPGPEHAESRCFECHTYHDWSKRKEITPKFTLPELGTGGR